MVVRFTFIGFCLTARNQSGVVLTVGPYKHNYTAMCPTQAHQSLFARVFPVILAGEHRAIKRFHAAGQVNAMLAHGSCGASRVVAHA